MRKRSGAILTRRPDQGHSHAMLVSSGILRHRAGSYSQDNLNADSGLLFRSATGLKSSGTGSRTDLGVLESRMTREDIDRAKAEAGRWHDGPSQAKTAVAPGLRPTASHATASSSRPGPASKSSPATTPAVPADPGISGPRHLWRQEERTRRVVGSRTYRDCASGSVFEIEEKRCQTRSCLRSGSVP